jgi:predicted DCC family thiol-disulfide oxidoreductase YuxK
MESKSNIIILYDGYCNLCDFTLKFILKRDKNNVFQYFTLQSEKAKELLANGDTKDYIPDSVFLLENEQLYSKSEAFFRILPYLGKRYKILFVLKVFPLKLRDKIYDWIAINRYRWFGQKSECGLPMPPGYNE